MNKSIKVYSGKWRRDINGNFIKRKNHIRNIDTSKCKNRNGALDRYPRAVFRQVIYRLRRKGGRIHDIANTWNISTRTVWKVNGIGLRDQRKGKRLPRKNKGLFMVKISQVRFVYLRWLHAYYNHPYTFQFDVDKIMRAVEPP